MKITSVDLKLNECKANNPKRCSILMTFKFIQVYLSLTLGMKTACIKNALKLWNLAGSHYSKVT